ncbi:MAG: molecular chaperone [Beijerinckiaceae bacterium]|nr:molecular chaperone [Beijerinckiaceae bacterium]
MKKPVIALISMVFLALTGALAPQGAVAAALQASPVLIELRADSPSATIQIRNTGQAPIAVQTRVYRWSQENGEESLDETDDLTASPPMTTLQPGTTYSVRLVRVNRQPVAQEQAYRVLVDELPDPNRQQSGTIAMVVRHSIPVFLLGPEGKPAQLSWSVGTRNGRLVLRATNSGDRRVRLSNVSVRLPGGQNVSFGNGLLGYALANSTMEWLSPGRASGSGGTITATTERGTVTGQAAGLR